ncbi:8863_t:CDS:2 [Cetraspora pellucida]|uniref:Mannosyltransferase n=1 Tax=Cetraspora pellucida TaxID=1433469 RepID=A0A9N8ZY20_9GLOM|nr:8863_t:CDS:2 [Cetraspora pellucida]
MVVFQRRRNGDLQTTVDVSPKTEHSFDGKIHTIFNNKNLLLSSLILFRLFNAFITKTFFSPDEYWQSVEVAHYMIYAPRFLQAVFAAISDFYSYHLARKLFTDSSAKWTLCLIGPGLHWLHQEIGMREKVISGIGIDEISNMKNSHLANSFTCSKKSAWLNFSIIFLVVTNVPMAYYAATIHQSGVVEVMNYLRDEADKGNVKNIGFLAPCHSTPFYSNLHRNLEMWFLTCEPLLNHNINLDDYLDEADQFYKNPLDFIYANFERPTFNTFNNSSPNNSLRKWPSHLIIFEVLLKDIESVLKQLEYDECARFFNSQFNDDSRRQGDIIVLCKAAI